MSPQPVTCPEQHQPSDKEWFKGELRLFIEEICCNLCRFRHAREDGIKPEQVHIVQETNLRPGAFADVRVQVKDCAPYFIEVKYGYSRDQIHASLTRKYGPDAPLPDRTLIYVVLDCAAAAHWAEIVRDARPLLKPGVELILWDETELLSMMREPPFRVQADSFSEQNILEMRMAVDRAKGEYAFGDKWTNDPVQHTLMWHYGFWRLRQLCDSGMTARTIMPPGLYPDVAVVMADLSSFSSYVRDTREHEVIRQCLSTFYAKARYEILNTGGMLYQFVGDEVIGLYGMPDRPSGYLEAALECAKALVDIGNSVSNEWQRKIDLVQRSRGVHIGMALGDMQIVTLRPFSRAHLGGIGEVINLAARLLAHDGPGEIVASNTYYQALTRGGQSCFRPCEPLEARNVGTIQAWKL